MLKLVKLPSLVAKYCKTWKIYACKVCILLYYAYHKMAELPVNFRHFVVSVIQKCTKFANFASVYFPYFTTFRHQTWQFTNFNMLFLAVVDFDFFAKMKIQLKRGMVHCLPICSCCTDLLPKGKTRHYDQAEVQVSWTFFYSHFLLAITSSLLSSLQKHIFYR